VSFEYNKIKLDLHKTKLLLPNDSPDYSYPVTPEFNDRDNWYEHDECNVPLSDDTAISTRELKKSSTLVFNLSSQKSISKIQSPLNINDEDYSTDIHEKLSPRKTYILIFIFAPNNDLSSFEKYHNFN
jgi:hypothetical protein